MNYIHNTIGFIISIIILTLCSLQLRCEKYNIKLILQQVVQLRGLLPKSKIKYEVASRNKLLTYIKNRIKKYYPKERLLMEEMILKDLKLIPEEFDYVNMSYKLLEEQIAGIYAPEYKILYIADWLDINLQYITIVHELVHALQDQHFNLEKLTNRSSLITDKQMALSSLIEGDAMAITLNYEFKRYGKSSLDFSNITSELINSILEHAIITQSNSLLSQVPRYIRDSLIFPYLYGLEFIKNLYLKGGWELINKAYTYNNIPQSTEEILHIDKYFAEKKNKLNLNEIQNLLQNQFSSMDKLFIDVLGEFNLCEYLLNYTNSPATAKTGGEGWDGDLLIVYYNSKELEKDRIVLHFIKWDTPADAKEYVNIMYESIFNQYNNIDETCFEKYKCRIKISNNYIVKGLLTLSNKTTLYIIRLPLHYYNSLKDLLEKLLTNNLI